MDWEKVGQAFQGGANVLAGGLMDKYQRKRDMEEWEKKTDYSADIERRQQQALQDLQNNEINYRAFLDMKKKEFDSDPELFSVWQAAQGGDERDQKILEKYSKVKHFADMEIPLLSEQIAELKDPEAPLPPGVRGRIIQSHMMNVNKYLKGQADLEAVKTRTERDKAMTKKALEDTQDYSDLYGDYAVRKKEQGKVTAQTKKDIESKYKEIKSLNDRIGGKQIELSRAGAAKNGPVFGAIKAEIERLQGLRSDAESWLSDLATTEAAGGAEEQARQKWATESAAKTTAPATPVNAVENIALTPEDMKEIAAAKKARPDLSEEAIIKAYVAYKRKR